MKITFLFLLPFQKTQSEKKEKKGTLCGDFRYRKSKQKKEKKNEEGEAAIGGLPNTHRKRWLLICYRI